MELRDPTRGGDISILASHSEMRVIKINPKQPQPAAIKEAERIIKAGGLVAYPTETFYGLAADALNPKAVKKIFKAKGRPEGKALIILISKIEELNKIARAVTPAAKLLIKKFWPGPLTLIFKKKAIVPQETSAGGHTIAVRISSHPVALALARACKRPITATSANLSWRLPHRTALGVFKEFKNSPLIDLLLDGGATFFKKPSTLLDATKKPPQIVRDGAIPAKFLKKYL